MQYSPPIITPAIRWDVKTFDIPLGVSGDTLFITPIPSTNTTLHLELASKEIPATSKPNVSLLETFDGVSSVVTEGEDLNITVALSQASTVDIECTLTVTHDGLDKVSPVWRKDEDVNGVDDHNDTISTYFSATTDADIVATEYTVVIPAGDTQASIVIPTIDDTTLIHGKGSYKVAKVEITSQDNPDYMVHFSKNESIVLIEDSSEYPKWGSGEVYLWCKMDSLCEWEPILDETGVHARLTFDWDKDEEGNITDSLGHTYPIDIVPFYQIQLRPDQDNVPVDMNETDPLDLSTNLPYFRVRVLAGYE